MCLDFNGIIFIKFKNNILMSKKNIYDKDALHSHNNHWIDELNTKLNKKYKPFGY